MKDEIESEVRKARLNVLIVPWSAPQQFQSVGRLGGGARELTTDIELYRP